MQTEPELSQKWPYATCCTGDDAHCVCGDMERSLRGWKRGALPKMTQDQREACLAEIGHVEGYDINEHRDETDAELANTVLRAWIDYARDKGLL
ncbi:hypothetical protein EN816_00660 [Mesorhizobium sp. M8A.F.Ca.ET.173.01.1.1]|nr:hypothetical protein EN816_00660 [Mesorhizobium sp. M8A.F.Ca.ET.173.01.1.1]